MKKSNIRNGVKCLKALGVLTVALTVSLQCTAQDVVSIDYLLGSPIKTVEKYNTQTLDSSVVLIPFDFANGSTNSLDMLDSIFSGSKPIVKIDFVYTRFKVSPDFDQKELNRQRLECLRERAPMIFDNNVIEWEFYEQANTFDLETNRSYFHGFAIHLLEDDYYAGNYGKMTTDGEITFISDYLKEIYPEVSVRSVSKIQAIDGKYLPISKRKREKGIRYHKKLIFWRKREAVTYDTLWVTESVPGAYRGVIADTVVIRTLRNYEDKWDCVLVVEDVTGSMYPYIAQTLAWKKLKMDSTKLQHFVFFNDGDSKPDGPIGKSGGAYYIHSNELKAIEDKVYSVMKKGYGGGAPENNVEATLYAEEAYGDSPSYILIADNNAPVRDMVLRKDIEKPIHLILCGVRNGRIHHSYITLAMTTGGSLHTIEEDIDSVPELKPGDTFDMGGQKFELSPDGRLILVR